MVLASGFPLAILVYTARHTGLHLVGVDALYVGDEYLYMSWIRDAGNHLLSSNLYDIPSGAHFFLHPMFLTSALAWKLGMSIPQAYLIWKPVALLVLFAGCAAYARRLLPAGWGRPLALLLAIFYAAPAGLLFAIPAMAGSDLVRSTFGVATETYSAWYLSGYLPTAIAIGLMPLYLIGLERLVDVQKRRPGRGPGWYLAWTCAAGVLTSWLHPWQGEILLVVTVGLLPWNRRWPRVLALGPPVAGLLAPLLYYQALPLLDPAWRLARAADQSLPPSPLAVLLTVLPLVTVALLALRPEHWDEQERLLRLWFGAVVALFLIGGADVQHLMDGLTIPLGILAVRGAGRAWDHLRRGQPGRVAGVLVGVAAVGVLAVANIANGAYFIGLVRAYNQPFLLRQGERQALDYLAARPGDGGVLAPVFIAQAVPPLTGRATWVGNPFFSPEFQSRADLSEHLFNGRLSGPDAQRAVEGSGAQYLLSDCNQRSDLAVMLGSLVTDVQRFGCATVYEVRSGRSPTGAAMTRLTCMFNVSCTKS